MHQAQARCSRSLVEFHTYFNLDHGRSADLTDLVVYFDSDPSPNGKSCVKEAKHLIIVHNLLSDRCCAAI